MSEGGRDLRVVIEGSAGVGHYSTERTTVIGHWRTDASDADKAAVDKVVRALGALGLTIPASCEVHLIGREVWEGTAADAKEENERRHKKWIEAVLAAAAEHFGEPVLPISRYCAALRQWQVALSRRRERYTAAGTHDKLADAVDLVFRELTKSNLAWRLLYGGQPLRTEMCPLHKGKWSGCSPDPCPHGCSDGVNVTGWLPVKTSAEAPEGKPGLGGECREGTPAELRSSPGSGR